MIFFFESRFSLGPLVVLSGIFGVNSTGFLYRKLGGGGGEMRNMYIVNYVDCK